METHLLAAFETVAKKHGDEEWAKARDFLAAHYDYLVKQEIQAVYRGNITQHRLYNDLVQQGRVGLLLAIKRADPQKASQFFAYAQRHIRKEIVALWHAEELPVRLPRDRGELAGKIRSRARDEHGNLLPLPQVIRMFPDTTPAMVETVWRCVQYTPVELDTRNITHHTPAAHTPVLANMETETLTTTIGTLPPPMGRIIRARFGIQTGEPQHLYVVAREEKISISVVKQLEHEALARLAHPTRQTKIAV